MNDAISAIRSYFDVGALKRRASELGNQIAQETDSGGHNDPGDAARHMAMVALLARRFGETPAKLAGYAHEFLNPNIHYEFDMDTQNNALGAQLGASAADDDDAINRVMQALRAGQAVVPTRDQAHAWAEMGDSLIQSPQDRIFATLHNFFGGR